jgi:glycerol-3-phosphate dehydrogenase
MRIAIVGAGINGMCSAVALAQRGCSVTVYERSYPFSETSSRSSKLLHGGIRYLENGHINLVREALEDRAWWVQNAPEYTKVNNFFIPIYNNSSRSRLKLYAGVKLYEYLAGNYSFGPSEYHNRKATLLANDCLSSDGLLGSVSYFDVQMDDVGLSKWLVKRAYSLGVIILDHTCVCKLSPDGAVILSDGRKITFDKIVNACGPWAAKILAESCIKSNYILAPVKGSHIIVGRSISNPIVIQVPEGNRIVFMLPCRNQTLIGTTEVVHNIKNKITCSDQEVSYLISVVNSVLHEPLSVTEVLDKYAGVRPIVSTEAEISKLSKASRDSVFERHGRVVSVFGGKWTSGMRLGETVANIVMRE